MECGKTARQKNDIAPGWRASCFVRTAITSLLKGGHVGVADEFAFMFSASSAPFCAPRAVRVSHLRRLRVTSPPAFSHTQASNMKGAVIAVLLLASPMMAWATGGSVPNIVRPAVELFVMSKCPDAVYCEQHLAPVLEELKGDITLALHFIGQQQDDGSWASKHGQEEKDGDLQQLCVQLHSKAYQRYDWLFRFVLCNDQQGLEAIGQFATAAKCLKQAGVPLSAATKMLGCMYGPGAADLVDADFAATAKAGVARSCTIQIDGNTVCVRDGDEWKDCPAGSKRGDFKQLICAAYAAANRGRLPRVCRALATAR